MTTTRQAVTQHLDVLAAAGLVTAVRRGREKLHYLNPVPLHDVYDRWIAKFERSDLVALSALKARLEQEGQPIMDKPKLVYVTYIASTPERVWQALTDPDVTARYWAHRNVSEWTKGGRWEHRRLDGGVDGVGTILDIDPPRRLAHTWAFPHEADDPSRCSRVTFDIEPVGDAVRLTVTHEDLPADQIDGTRAGRAKVVSSMKSLLETGKPLVSVF
ncbi:MAG TPA: SRPBCC domain-containing protein [Micromonosporaceae bacterium]